jgi:uncharacterized protein (DUF1697 family)
MTHVALLRGINVGGKTKVEMSRLKKVFEDLGCKNVKTYINSGNVIFSDARTATDLRPLVEKAIEDTFGFSVGIVLRTAESIEATCKAVPEAWTNDTVQKTDVIFLWDDINNPDVLNKVSYKPEIEHVIYVDGALVWNIARENVTRGSAIKLIKSDIYKYMTVRNINTVRKLNELCYKND